jgi:hypothetical protein
LALKRNDDKEPLQVPFRGFRGKEIKNLHRGTLSKTEVHREESITSILALKRNNDKEPLQVPFRGFRGKELTYTEAHRVEQRFTESREDKRKK